MPNINAASAECNNLTIQTGASVTISTSNSLDVYAIWDNSGTFTANKSTVNFIGSATQSITATATQSFYNITLNNASGLDVSSSPLNLIGTLTLTSGAFNTNNMMTLISDANGTARIAEITGGRITGNITMQR